MAHNYRVREGERKQGTCGGGLHGWGVHRGGISPCGGGAAGVCG